MTIMYVVRFWKSGMKQGSLFLVFGFIPNNHKLNPHFSEVPDESESEEPIGAESPEESSLSILENSPPVILSMS